MIVLKALGRAQETIKNLEKIQGDIESINIVVEECGLNAVIRFKNSMSDWRVVRISEEDSNFFCSFVTLKQIFFKRQ